MTIKEALLLFLTAVLLPAGQSRAGDWPHWRGPYLNGSSDEKNLPATWSDTENIAWTAALPGHSSATPIISGDKVFVSSTDRNSSDLLALCFDTRTGKELWRKKLGASGRKVPRNRPAKMAGQAGRLGALVGINHRRGRQALLHQRSRRSRRTGSRR